MRGARRRPGSRRARDGCVRAGGAPSATRRPSGGTPPAGTVARRRRSAQRAAAESGPRRTNLTGRAAVLALVVCALALTLAYPVRSYLGQRADIAELEQRLVLQQARVEALQSARGRWEDPAYVKAQARERLHYVMPGETQYVVLEPEEAPAPEDDDTRDRSTRSSDRPWFTLLWQTVEGAAGTGAGSPASAPAPSTG